MKSAKEYLDKMNITNLDEHTESLMCTFAENYAIYYHIEVKTECNKVEQTQQQIINKALGI